MSSRSSLSVLVVRLHVLFGLILPTNCVPQEVPEPPAPATTARAAEQPSVGLTFRIGKWEDPEGLRRTEVAGRFRDVSVTPLGACGDPGCLVGARASVVVGLDSLDTSLPVRDANIMRGYFDTASFPTARADFQIKAVDLLPDGSMRARADVQLDLHGLRAALAPVSLELRREGGAMHVRTVEPISIPSAKFGMPVAALLALCGHAGIDPAATVEFDGLVALPGASLDNGK